MESDADLDSSTKSDFEPPLLFACRVGNQVAARAFLEHSADVMDPDIQGLSVLHYAVMKFDVPFAELAISRGADVNVSCSLTDGSPLDAPLHLAVKHPVLATAMEFTQLFLAKGGQVDIIGYGGMTPLMYAADRFSWITGVDLTKFPLCALLLANGAEGPP